MPKERYQITLNDTLVARARSMMATDGFDSLSEFLEHLIREENARRHPAADAFHEAPAAVPVPASKTPVTYRKGR